MWRAKWFGRKILLAHIQQPTLERAYKEEKIIFKTGVCSEYVVSAAIFCTFSVHCSCWSLYRIRVLSVDIVKFTEQEENLIRWQKLLEHLQSGEKDMKHSMLKTQEGERQKLRNNKPKWTCLKTGQMDLRNVVCWLASVAHLHLL